MAVLKDGRTMAPAFQAGEVLCHDITTTSVRVTWPKFSDKKYPVYAYRVCTAEVGNGFEVVYGEAPSHTAEAVIVGLKPGKTYQFLVASVSAERMLVPGSSIVSNPVQLPEAEYERAWFFEGGEDDIKWTAFEGLEPESVRPTGGGGGGDGCSSAALDDIRCSLSTARCFTGLRSLYLTLPPGLTGGAYVDTPVKQGWLYVVKAKVFHENEASSAPAIPGAEAGGGAAGPGVSAAERKGSALSAMTSWATGRKGSAKAAITTRLVLWDMRDGKEMSAPAVKTGEWEALECQIVPFRSEHLRITIQSGGEGWGNIYVDAVELFHGGPTPAERAISSVIDVMDKPRSMPAKARTPRPIAFILVRVESARNVRAADVMGTSDPFVKIIVGGIEVQRTKVIPMTLSPMWDETFLISPQITAPIGDPNPSAGAEGGDGVRLELWDHDLHGEGDYLGEVTLTNEKLKTAPPHRAEHQAARHPARSGDGGGGNATVVSRNPKAARARKKRSGKGAVYGGGTGAGAPPTLLALAVQVSWPEDSDTAEGKLVSILQDEDGLLPARVKALKELSMTALREPRNIEDAAKVKEALLRARAAEAAVWVLPDPDFLEDACRLLTGLVKLGHDAGRTEAGFGLCRRLKKHVLQLSPAVVAVRCLRANAGPPEVLLDLLAKLYADQQAALHKDAHEIKGFFYSLVLHIDTVGPAQALVREISGGGRELPAPLLALFRRYRTRIPPLPGLWRTSGRAGGASPPTVSELARGSLTVALMAAPPLFMAVVGARRVGGSGGGGSCEQPVGAVLLLDGLLLLCAAVGGGCFRLNRRRFSVLAGTWLFPTLLLAFLLHLGLVAGLLVSVARVTAVEAGGGRDEDDGKVTCSTGTFAWGVAFLALHCLALLCPPVLWCVRCYDRVTRSSPAVVASATALVVPDEGPTGDASPVCSEGGGAAVERVVP
ncbi:unnamed protein product [Scytosiphon promiscuus]